jgi:hypothetical protein
VIPGYGAPRHDPNTWQDAYGNVHSIDDHRDHARSDPDDGTRKLRTQRASQVTMERAVWLWETDGYGRIPCGEITLAAGRGNVGKSPFALWLCAQLSQGTLPGAHYGEPVQVAVYASEDSHAHTTVPRLEAAGADLDMVDLIIGTTNVVGEEETLEWWRDIDLIEAHLKATQAKFLVIDPLHDVHRDSTDTNKTDDVRRGIKPLVAMAHRIGVTILGLAHFNKAKTNDVASLLSGSHGLRDIARAVLVFIDVDGQKVIGQDKNNLGRSGDDVPRYTYEMDIVPVDIDGHSVETPVFNITGTTNATIGDLVGGTVDAADRAVPVGVQWMFALLCAAYPCPMSAATLQTEAEHRGFKWDTARRAAKKTGLMDREKQPGVAHGGWEWKLTDDGIARFKADDL